MAQRVSEEQARIHVENVGGIDETDVAFSPGVTILAGRNATNRTSLLRALMAGLGSDDVSIKGGADEATVELEIDDQTYTRRFIRRDGTVVSDGEPYLEDSTVADLFAFLLESNEARRAVREGRDLRDIIMRPIDTEEIQSEIDRLVEERNQLEAELEEIESLKGELPTLEEQRASIQDDIEAKREELEAKEAELEEADADVEETREEKEELEDRLSTLSTKRSDLEDVRYQLDTERETISSLKSQREDLEAELEDLPEAPMGEVDELDSRIDRLRAEKQSLESDLDELQSIISFNEEMLEDTADELLAAFQEDDEEALTEQLLDDDTTTCWTCGSDVEKAQIERTIEQLRSLSQEQFQEISDIEAELDELTEQRRELEETQRERERLENRLDRLETELQESRDEIERLQNRREELTDEIAEIEAAVEELEGKSYGDVLDLHKEANQLEYELGRLENDRDRVDDEIERIEDRLDEQDAIEAELEGITEEIESLRTKIDRIEQQAIEGFNDHMDAMLDLLGYENLERIWLERKEQEVRQDRREVHQPVFELHIIRSTPSNTTYEDTVSNLSESEREVTGLIFALAGYLAHDLHERVPFMLLDSLEAIDADRLAVLVDYLRDYSDYLVVALLTEDAQGLSDEYERVTEI
ncbi:MAG: archaea-specific SMC-related protein [Haloglomus sp.]